jgi:hypothetical protein
MVPRGDLVRVRAALGDDVGRLGGERLPLGRGPHRHVVEQGPEHGGLGRKVASQGPHARRHDHELKLCSAHEP